VSVDGRTLYAVGRRNKSAAFAVFVSHDGGKSFAAHDIEQLAPDAPEEEELEDRFSYRPTASSLAVQSLTTAEDGTLAIVFRRFGLSEQDLGLVFFVVHILNALSHLGAAWLASRIGLVNTMVFTHLPSSLLLMTVPFASSAKLAIALFFAREALVEMDVPTRQSYVASLVRPSERSFASAITNVARATCWAIGSGVAGVLMQNLAFSAPLIVGGGTKITYDLLLYKLFRRLKPPEESRV